MATAARLGMATLARRLGMGRRLRLLRIRRARRVARRLGMGMGLRLLGIGKARRLARRLGMGMGMAARLQLLRIGRAR
jgi:hypothetical protein